MSYKNSKANSGFTIIEVLIVLAIAGLILLIVFLAVPALQRNSRNTAIKNDVQNVLGGVSEFQGANNGKLPSTTNGVSGTGTITYTAGTGSTQTSINIQGTTKVTTVATAPTANGSVPQGEIQIVIGKKCDGSSSTRAVAAYYMIETTAAASATAPTCVES